jgi:hypothetical protein
MRLRGAERERRPSGTPDELLFTPPHPTLKRGANNRCASGAGYGAGAAGYGAGDGLRHGRRAMARATARATGCSTGDGLWRGRWAAAGMERFYTGPFEGPPTTKPPPLPENLYCGAAGVWAGVGVAAESRVLDAAS